MITVFAKFLCVAAGSCLGGVCRYAVSRWFQENTTSTFPWGTFTVNIVGCLIIGLIYGIIDRGFNMSEGLKLFLTVGFCGGFTTFSTLMHENYLLISPSGFSWIILYAVSSLAVGLAMVYGGYYLAKVFI